MPVKIFFCYAREDEQLLNKLKNHLFPLKRTGFIDIWHDRDISAGTGWEQQIKSRPDLDEALYNVTEGIRKVIEEITPTSFPPSPVQFSPSVLQTSPPTKLSDKGQKTKK
jgi:hypothetical protein